MDKFLIKGPCKIKGKVSVSGSKNASLPILASTLLFDQPVIIKNLPRVKDINTMLNLLKSLGSKIILSKDKQTAKIYNKKYENFASYSLVKTMRVQFSIRTLQQNIMSSNFNLQEDASFIKLGIII